ncbi:uncharacterized protein RHIMIDRAFT_233492 [Rhizopus microsporus ATCC 52813]|uniref:Uncharacterized protein n=1 Tax=Rhizopus microsporus ATCC 52813 TaxID=1340429 RepID=A0A2G4T4D8_RHIZD|nr:uncharacterized protein RHIMIDRAFT_233492 [Rhizopus microsporus ATCC 52813]PHZ15884.1 hypothetical protein RHIMIDRAFT_233492 [Rhizopus microsporus ATCC 52813]
MEKIINNIQAQQEEVNLILSVPKPTFEKDLLLQQARPVKERREYEFLSYYHLSFVYSHFFGKRSRTLSNEESRHQYSSEYSENWIIQDDYKRRPPFVLRKSEEDAIQIISWLDTIWKVDVGLSLSVEKGP